MGWKGFIIAVLFFTIPLCAKQPELICKKKFGEVKWEGMKLHRYCLRAENFPPKQNFKLIVKSFDGTQTETFGYVANQRGHLILQPPEDLEGEDVYAICPLRRGERVIFGMQDAEGKLFCDTDLIPFPLEMRSKKGIRLNLELKGEKGEKFLLFAQGFKPYEPVTVLLQIDDLAMTIDAKVTSLGDLSTLLEVENSSAEKATLLIKRKSEEVVFPFAWGTPALAFVGACCLEIR